MECRSAEGKPFQGIRGRSPVVALKKDKQQKNWMRDVLREKKALLNVMKREFVLGFQYACHLWRRTDLEARPFNIIRVAQVLTEAGIEVFEVDIESSCLSCAPRPLAVREALTGEYTADYISGKEYPSEIPGVVLKLLAEKGITTHFEKNL
ncbi:MAG: hypothetical protein FJ263_05705 [Planctomycetes bacterium]|nr:hypothetical protein [Planctomycetota bacterium]